MKEKHQKKGFWTAEEDQILMDYIRVHGKGRWNRIAKSTGLNRCGKSCRLRWMNYLSPNVKRGNFTEQEEDLIIRLHNLLGNRWSLIAGRVPGRTDNQVKNYWNTHLSKKLGIKRVKNNASGPSAVGENSTIPEDPTVKNTSCDGNGGASGPQMKAYDPFEPFMNGCPTSPYWVCDDDSLDVISPSLMELLNGYPPDVAYHEFQPYICGYTNF